MTARSEILDLLQSAEVMAESDIERNVNKDGVTAALQGLSDEGVVLAHRLPGQETYYSLGDNVNRTDIEQAAERVSVQEIAEQMVKDSTILGDPNDGTPESDNLWSDLF